MRPEASRHLLAAAVLSTLGAITACSDPASPGDGSAIGDGAATDSGGDGGHADGGATGTPTWYQDIQPMMAEHCWTCHNASNDDAAFDFSDPAMAVELADWLNAKINGPDDEPPYQMPPFPLGDDEECDLGLPITGDLRMSAEDKALFQEWVDAGTPLGDADAAAPYDIPPPREMWGDRIEDLSPMSMTTRDGQKGDAYNCWSWDLGITDPEGAWLTGLRVNPDNLNIVHHAVIMADYSGRTAPAGGGDGKCPQPDDEVPDATMLATWAPGADPIILPTDAGMHFPPGTRLVSATHYHPNGTGQHDATNITLAWRDTPPAYEVVTLPLGAADPGENDVPNWEERPFHLAAGDDDYVNTWRDPHQHPDDKEFRIWGLFPHMHYAATSMKVTLEHEDGTATCIADVPVWEFDWQRTYEFDVPYDELPILQDGDTFAIRCGYNNSASNPLLAEKMEENGLEFQDISIGNGYLDEMCVLHAIIMQEYDGRFEREAAE